MPIGAQSLLHCEGLLFNPAQFSTTWKKFVALPDSILRCSGDGTIQQNRQAYKDKEKDVPNFEPAHFVSPFEAYLIPATQPGSCKVGRDRSSLNGRVTNLRAEIAERLILPLSKFWRSSHPDDRRLEGCGAIYRLAFLECQRIK